MEGGQVQRALRIERIVVASLVADFETKWPDVRHCVTPDMFRNPFCRRVFKTVERMAEEGREVNMHTVWKEMGPLKVRAMMLAKLDTNDFNTLKWTYVTTGRLARNPTRDVTFADYVTQLINNNERQ